MPKPTMDGGRLEGMQSSTEAGLVSDGNDGSSQRGFETVLSFLSEAILDCTFVAGSRLPTERQLTEDLRVSPAISSRAG
jgi:hypothetical protein